MASADELPPDLETARRMVPLLERGDEARRRMLATRPARERPQGGGDVVTQTDFAKYAVLCLRHVQRNAPSLHILCDDGVTVALLQCLSGKW